MADSSGSPDSARARVSGPPEEGTRTGYLAKLTIISTLGGLLFGYDTGVISGALLDMQEDLNLTPTTEAWVVSSLLFPGAAMGALVGGRLADALGRRGALFVCGALFLVAARTRARRCATYGPSRGCGGSCGSAAVWPRSNRRPASTR